MTLAEDPEYAIFSLSILMLSNKSVYVTSNAFTHQDGTLHNYFYEGMSIMVDGAPYRIMAILRQLLKIQVQKEDDPSSHLILDVNSSRISVTDEEVLKAYTRWLNSLRPGSPVDFYGSTERRIQWLESRSSCFSQSCLYSVLWRFSWSTYYHNIAWHESKLYSEGKYNVIWWVLWHDVSIHSTNLGKSTSYKWVQQFIITT